MAQTKWRTMNSAPRNGIRILGTDGINTHVCYPKLFPRPVDVLREQGRDPTNDEMPSMPGDTWEYFRDDENAPGHTWSFTPDYWMPIPLIPKSRVG